MISARLDRLEQKLRQDHAPSELVDLLRELKVAHGDDSPTPDNLSLADALAGIIDRLPN
jgi:hypothetical protein